MSDPSSGVRGAGDEAELAQFGYSQSMARHLNSLMENGSTNRAPEIEELAADQLVSCSPTTRGRTTC